MPRKLRREKQRTALSLDSLGITEILAFTTCWSPPVDDVDRARFPRWESWAEYFADWDLVRPLLIVSQFHKPGAVVFADTARVALAAAGPGESWGKHDHAALRHAHLYQRGDGHIHDDDERLGAAIEAGA